MQLKFRFLAAGNSDEELMEAQQAIADGLVRLPAALALDVAAQLIASGKGAFLPRPLAVWATPEVRDVVARAVYNS